MDAYNMMNDLLREIGPGLSISRSAYDTAWVARLADLDEPMGERAMEWLRTHQLADGSWGADAPTYYHDRLVCTLAAMTALTRSGQAQDHIRCQRAQVALETIMKGLEASSADETAGFEMIVPTLLAEAKSLGLIRNGNNGNGTLGRLSRKRAAKLASLPEGMINRHVTVAFSTEMVGQDGLHLLDLENLRETNGSVACSPSATAFFTLHVHRQDPAALAYLRRVADHGAVPYVAPIDVFEQAWTLWNLTLTGPLDDDLLALCQPHLDFLQAKWDPREGAPSAAQLTCRDGDATSLVYEVLTRFGRPANLQAVSHYEADDRYLCYPLEANPSISTNVHVLGALRQAGLEVEHPSVTKTLGFLSRTQTSCSFWFDKWHASPYYPTAHAIIAAAGYADRLVDSAVRWILATQNPNGSWGYYVPTAEETAYCLQALVTWKRHGHPVSDDVLKRGAAWLAEHTEPPYPTLWIGKCLYCPELVVRSSILSALMLVTTPEH